MMGFPLIRLGVPPCWRAYFFLLRQEKVAKKKATPRSAPGYARSLALLGRPGGWLNSPAAQTTPAEGPRPACVAQRLSGGPQNTPRNLLLWSPREKSQKPDRSSGPLERCRATQVLAEKGRGLSEARRAEFRSPRQCRVAQGTRAAGTDPGSPFLCLLSFGEAKESKARRKRETQR